MKTVVGVTSKLGCEANSTILRQNLQMNFDSVYFFLFFNFKLFRLKRGILESFVA